MIEGIKIIPLKQIKDERGKIMHMLRSDSEIFEKFGLNGPIFGQSYLTAFFAIFSIFKSLAYGKYVSEWDNFLLRDVLELAKTF